MLCEIKERKKKAKKRKQRAHIHIRERDTHEKPSNETVEKCTLTHAHIRKK